MAKAADRYKTFDAVDEKVAEAEFFLGKMRDIKFDVFAMRCFFSAFLAACRTITQALQQFRKLLDGFDEWYEPHRQRLVENKLAKFFHATRNDHLHGGNHPITGGMGGGSDGSWFYHFENLNISEKNRAEIAALAGDVYEPIIDPDLYVPDEDVLTCCEMYFKMLLEIVYDCYVDLGPQIDPQQHYTQEHFSAIGKTVHDACCEMFGEEISFACPKDMPEEARWQIVRRYAGCCGINEIFYQYLGKVTPGTQVDIEE